MKSEQLVEIYKRAHLASSHSDRVVAEVTKGKVRMPFHSPRGQEIVPAALSMHLTDADYVVTTYRGAHDLICKGVPLKHLWAEYAGRETGTCKGKGGPMHLTYPDVGAMVTTGVVGSGLPIANGLALSAKVDGDSRVTVCNFGDGASNIGAFHEALNLASLWQLGVVFVCQNNRYGEHTAFARSTTVENISDRASSYGMPGVLVDGNDAAAMHAAADAAITRARRGEGPTLIEAMTFRFHGHSLGDNSHYMQEGELEAAVKNDPVPALRETILGKAHASEEELYQLESENLAKLDEAIDFAYSSDYPDVDEIRFDVFEKEVA